MCNFLGGFLKGKFHHGGREKMLIGTCQIRIVMYEVGSLKEKRQILKSVIERIKARYNVSIAEIGDQDKWQVSEIGFCCISNSSKHAQEMIDKIIYFIEQDGRFDITECQVDIL